MRVLKVDLDFHPPEHWVQEWKVTRRQILACMDFEVEKIEAFHNTRGMHFYIKLNKEVSDREGNRLQFLLGDDSTRVKINNWRIDKGIKHWNKLFSKVLYRRKAKVLTCYYCGNKIPVPDRWFKHGSD